jgi:hypothetical protein
MTEKKRKSIVMFLVLVMVICAMNVYGFVLRETQKLRAEDDSTITLYSNGRAVAHGNDMKFEGKWNIADGYIDFYNSNGDLSASCQFGWAVKNQTISWIKFNGQMLKRY